jgi:GNAT superfamily N-acetyltransferase
MWMEFKKAVDKDINNIMSIIKKAQQYFKEKNIDQWQNKYPNFQTIKNDIKNKNSYVLFKENKILGTAVVIFEKEKNYEVIYDGEWISNGEYATIHRIAIDSNYKGFGLGSVIIEGIEEICLNRGKTSVRVDTHIENLSMQKLLEKNKYRHCGTIYLEDGSKRIAFEKILREITRFK